MAVLLQTALGDVVVDLFVGEEEAAWPVARNFLKLCASRTYEGCLFYNVQPQCLAQTGDPTGTGRGGAAWSPVSKKKKQQHKQLPKEHRTTPDGRFLLWEPPDGAQTKRRAHDAPGLVSMACMGRVGGGRGELAAYGSQFFLTLRGDDLAHLDEGLHCVIGQVAEGEDVLEKLNRLYLDADGRPWEDVRVRAAHVLDDPYPVEDDDDDGDHVGPDAAEDDGDVVPIAPPPTETIVARAAFGTSEKRAKEREEGSSNEAELFRKEAEKKAKSQAQVLEMIGDLPHADVEVPKNEIFIAKLNKVTEDRDLEIIFSRFGKIESCDVVRDWKTGDSLNFAFIAFEDERAAVEAYRKMNNVLVDDSRIKVDFSQSVAKIWSRYTLKYRGAAAREQRLKEKAREYQQANTSTGGHYGPSSSRRGSSHNDARVVVKREEKERGELRGRVPPSRRGDYSGSNDQDRNSTHHRPYGRHEEEEEDRAAARGGPPRAREYSAKAPPHGRDRHEVLRRENESRSRGSSTKSRRYDDDDDTASRRRGPDEFGRDSHNRRHRASSRSPSPFHRRKRPHRE